MPKPPEDKAGRKLLMPRKPTTVSIDSKPP